MRLPQFGATRIFGGKKFRLSHAFEKKSEAKAHKRVLKGKGKLVRSTTVKGVLSPKWYLLWTR